MTNAVVEREDPAIEAVRLIRSRSDQFLDLLGGDQRALERWMTVALHAVTSNPNLLRCTPASVLEAVRDSASMGLELNGLMGEGYVIPYKGKAQFQVGWRGLLRLARRSGDIAAIDAQMVYGHDAFDIDLGTEARIVHKPALSDRGERVGVYGWARLTSGELVVEWMDNDSVEMVRRSSQGQSGPWVDWYDEMARKTVIKRLCKRLPLDSLAQKALEVEARADSLADEPVRPTRQLAPATAQAAVQRVHEHLGITQGRRTPTPEWQEVEEAPDEPPPPVDQQAGVPAAIPTPSTAGSADPDIPMPAPASGSGVDPLASEPDVQPARCEGFHKELGACRREAGHKGNHQNADKESWK